MVLAENLAGPPAPPASDPTSQTRSRKFGAYSPVSPFQDDSNGDENTEASSSCEEDGPSNDNTNVPTTSSSSCDRTDSVKSSPTRVSFSISCGGETETYKSESPDATESKTLLSENSIPDIKIVQPNADNPKLETNGSGRKDDATSKTQGQKFVPPDGGYGWVVAVAACLANVWIIGFLRSYSILYLRIMREYGDSAYEASWIHALLTTTGFLFGPITGVLCRKFGARRVCIGGGLCAFSGIFLSSFATSIIPFIFTLGLLTGIGVGFVSTPGILIVNLYFEKRRGVACALCMSGNAIGAFMMPPLLEYLLLEYGLRGTLLISSALQLHILVSAFLFRPTDVHVRIKELDRKRALRAVGDKAELPHIVEDINKDKKWSKLAILQPDHPQNPSSKFASIDVKQKETRDSLTLELSSYRSMPLTASVPNLKEFRESLINMQVWHKDTDVNSNGEQNKTDFPHIASAEEFVRPKRKRSSSECQYTERALNFDVSYLRSLDVSVDESPELESMPHNFDGSQKDSLQRNVADKPIPAGENHTEVKDVESPNKTENLTTSNASSPLLGNANERSENLSKHEDGSLNKRTSSEPHKNTVQEDFKLFSKAIGEYFDANVLKSKHMIIIGISAFLYSMGVPQALFYLHAFYTSVGMHITEVTYLLSVTAICDFCGRVSIGFIADTNYFRLSYLIGGCMMLASAGALSVPSTSTLVTAASAMGCYSFGVGSFIVLLPTILAKNHGIDRLPATYGFTRLAMGLSTFIAPQIIGALVDGTNNYFPAYYLMGACMSLGAVLAFFMPPPPPPPPPP